MKKLLVLALCLMMALPAFAVAETPVTWTGTISVAPYLFGPWDEAKDIVVHPTEALMKERYGLDVTFDVVFVENANYREIINTRIAGGTAPDVFIGGDAVVLSQYYDQGAIASWDVDFFKENAPATYEFLNNGGYQGRLKDFVDMFWKLACAEDGKMTTVPYFDEQSAMPGKTLMYREDWLDALGVAHDKPEDLPMTLDDFVALLYRFANEDPDGNGVKDTFGCSESVVRAIFGAYGSSYNSRLWLEDGEGGLIASDVKPANKDALELLKKLYDDGVLDPEFVTGENNGGYWAVNHAFINGVIGASCHASIDHYRRPDVMGDNGGPVAIEWYAINGADSDFVYAPWPAGPDGEYGLDVGYPVSLGTGYAYDARLNDDPEKLAAIFKIMDIFGTDDEIMLLNCWGVEGEDYAVNEDGSLTNFLNTTDRNEKGIRVLRGLFGPEKVNSERGMFLDFYGDKTIKNRLDFFENPQCDMYRKNIVTGLLPSASEYNSELDTLRNETFVAIITGTQPLDSYDEYVQEWMDRGGDILTEEANAWYAENK